MSGLSEAHPGTDELTAFDRGHLRPAERDAVERHVAACDDCCRRLEALAEDSLAVFLRASAAPPSPDATCALSAEGQALAPQAVRPAGAEVPAELADHPRYRVVGVLGEGGMGTVYKAEHRLMGRTVALKVIRKSLTDRAGAVERFRQEVRAAARLSHPNIVTAYDAEQAGDLHFLVMEYVEGVSLDELVRRRGPLPAAEACDLARQAALGLQHAHERGMVHRDVKPHNLLRTPDGRVKILDFGLARFLSETGSGALTAPGTVVGTPDYVAPEQARDAHQADIRADIYSLGCTLYFLLAGRPPFPEGSALQKLMAHQQQRPPSLAERRPDLPAALLAVLDRMMAKEPDRRYRTPAEVAEQLAPLTAATPAPAALVPASPGGPDEKTISDAVAMSGVVPGRGRRRPRGRLVLVAVLAALGGIGLLITWLLVRQPAPRPPAPPARPEGETASFGDPSATFWRVLIHPDCRVALVVREGKIVYVWDLTTGREVGRLEGHTDRPLALALSADGRRALTGGMDGTIRLWDVPQRALTRTLDNHGIWTRGVDFWGSKDRVVSGDNHSRVVLWDANTGRPLHVFAGHEALIYDLKVSGPLAISASDDHTARVWNLGERRQAQCLRGHDQAVTCAILSGDQRHALTGSADRSVRYWDLAAEKALQVLRGHTATVNALALSSDPRRRLAASGDQSGFVRVWDLTRGEQLCWYREPGGRLIRAVAFSPDGRSVLSADEGGMFRLWKVP